jgi:hypothetical protein
MEPHCIEPPRLRLVHSAPPRPIEVRLVAIAGLYPHGVTKIFQLPNRTSLARLLEFAERLEAAG